MKIKRFFLSLTMLTVAFSAFTEGRIVQTPYKEPKVVFEFFLDHPDKIGARYSGSVPFSIRSSIRPTSPEEMSVKVVLHGTAPS